MPKETFYNLPEAKREKLILAIKEELTEQPFEKVSINKIIHVAEIPRGSFYQYFEDKNDMLSFIVSGFRDEMFEKLIRSLDENNGNIFKTFDKLLSLTLERLFKPENINLGMNFFGNIKTSSLLCFKMAEETEKENRFDKLSEHIDKSMLNLSCENDLKLMMGSIFSLFRDSVLTTFMGKGQIDIITKRFRRTLELMQMGYLKKE